MSLLCLNHLPTCLAMMVLGQWLTPHVPLSLSSSKYTHNWTQCFIVLFIFIDKSFCLAWIHTFSISRYGNQVYADELDSLYGESRAKGLGSEVHTSHSFLISNLAANFLVALHIPIQKKWSNFMSIATLSWISMFNTCLVKMRILMGTYALSAAGYYDAYYKRAQQVLLTLFYVFLGRSDLPLKSSPMIMNLYHRSQINAWCLKKFVNFQDFWWNPKAQ